ncbi:MAG: alpha/beta hydrolase [Rhodobacterales bacterium]|nr:alpha/beta hydrolase [Rhodobacterales bacterium]
MFDSFDLRDVDTGDVTLRVRTGGDGPPLLLLHGYPQTHAMWHKVAPALAERFTVVAPDLRGYGDSAKPPSDDTHAAYAKRAMAADVVRLMTLLGHDRFQVAGHDRGGRVTHRLLLDHPERVHRAAVLDIIPTHKLFATVNQAVATGYYHWFFLIQGGGLPERLIGAAPEDYLMHKLGQWSAGRGGFSDAAVAEYRRCFADPATIHASCEDYRAAATIDLVHDEADMDRTITCPLLVLWGAEGLMARSYDVLETWRERAQDVRGHALPCGHFLPEEAPQETLDAFQAFFDSDP